AFKEKLLCFFIITGLFSRKSRQISRRLADRAYYPVSHAFIQYRLRYIDRYEYIRIGAVVYQVPEVERISYLVQISRESVQKNGLPPYFVNFSLYERENKFSW